jgi:hypothetical protein
MIVLFVLDIMLPSYDFRCQNLGENLYSYSTSAMEIPSTEVLRKFIRVPHQQERINSAGLNCIVMGA